jgi:hypothetical protein
MSNSQKGELNHRYGKPAYNRRELYALNLENGVFEIFQNLKEAEEFFKIVNGTIRYYIRKEKPFKNHFIFY